MAAGLVLLPLLALVSCAVLSLTAMQRGTAAGWRSGGLAAVALAGVAFASGTPPQVLVASAASLWVPALAVTQILARSGSLSLAAQLATATTVLVAGGWAVFAPESVLAWKEPVQAIVTPFAGQTGIAPEVLVERLLPLVPGILPASLLAAALAGLFLAMWLHAGLSNPGAFGEAFRGLQLGPILGGAALLAVVAVAMTGSAVAAAVALPLVTALAMQGLAVMHGLARAKHWHRAWVAAGWAAFVLLSPWATMGFALYGLADTFMNLRRPAKGT